MVTMDYLILCVGNRDGGDDAVGPYIADRLQGKNLLAVDCGITPENYTAVVKQHRPRTLIIVDAVEMGLPPGELRIIPKEKLGTMHISTHGIPLSLLIQYLEKDVPSILFIGIQPQTMSGRMSPPVRKSATLLLRLLNNKKLEKIPVL